MVVFPLVYIMPIWHNVTNRVTNRKIKVSRKTILFLNLECHILVLLSSVILLHCLQTKV